MTKTTRRIGRAIAVAAVAGAMCTVGSVAAFGHGYIGGGESDMIARAAWDANANRGPVQYEPQSLEAPKGFPEAGPPDGQIASAGQKFGPNLDEQSPTRWAKNDIHPGLNTVHWTITADHRTAKWHYYITKNGWDQSAPLTRATFQPLLTVPWDGSLASRNPDQILDIPADHTGYHVILAVWDIADTGNAFYNVIDVDIQGEAPPAADTENPTSPTGLTTTRVARTEVDLAWNPASDDIAVRGYRVFRNGEQIGTTSNTTFTDTGLELGTTYSYQVQAVDTSDKVSALSEPILVTTKDDGAPDTEAPTPPSGLHSMGTTATSVDLMWNASTDDIGVVGYRIQRTSDGITIQDVATTSETRYLDTGLMPGTQYYYVVQAFDAAGNATYADGLFQVRTLPA